MTDMTADIWHRDGIDWGEAPLPPEDHRCFVQTSGWIGLNQWLRCPCGAIAAGIDLKSVQGLKSYEADDGLWNGLWMERNNRRRYEEKKAMMPDWQNPPYDQDAPEPGYRRFSIVSHLHRWGFIYLAISLVVFLAFAFGVWRGHETFDMHSQRNFPCQEDEVLGYSPAFGPDRVGCLHVDLLVP